MWQHHWKFGINKNKKQNFLLLFLVCVAKPPEIQDKKPQKTKN
jgi:hypothetical protein